MRAFLLLVISVAVAHAASITGKVVGVHDGDTITVLVETRTNGQAQKEQVRVRLHGIDAPESKQAFGSRAKEELSTLVFGKQVQVEVVNKDRYGRTVGTVSYYVAPDTLFEVNVEMIRRGFAWWYREYARNKTNYGKAEADAKAAKRGLWADKAPVAPWEFRKTEAKQKAS